MAAVASWTKPLVVAQVCALLFGFILLTFAPPANGRMLLIPIGHAENLISQALASGAQVVARGPVEGSLILEGTRSRLIDALGWGNVLILAAPQSGCGTPAPVSRT